MTETPKKASNIRQAVDFGALVAFMAAYAVNRFARGLDGQEALVQATWVLVGASLIALIVGYVVERRLAPLPLLTGGFALIFGVLTIVYLILGTALDGISMIVLTSAVVLPMIQKAGFDLIWFGIFIVLLVEIAEVTPPVGFNLFVLQNMTGRSLWTVAKAAFPFFLLLNVAVVIITAWPELVTYLPKIVFPDS